jgi:hypothetical protein
MLPHTTAAQAIQKGQGPISSLFSYIQIPEELGERSRTNIEPGVSSADQRSPVSMQKTGASTENTKPMASAANGACVLTSNGGSGPGPMGDVPLIARKLATDRSSV